MHAFLLVAATVLLLASDCLAQLSSLRVSLPGSLHQCEVTNLFFFNSGGTRPLSILFIPSANVPPSIRTGTVTLTALLKYEPVFGLAGINIPDATSYDFTLGIAQGQVVEAFGFYPDGSGKALSLTRTIDTALPGATDCLAGTGNVPPPVTTASVAHNVPSVSVATPLRTYTAISTVTTSPDRVSTTLPQSGPGARKEVSFALALGVVLLFAMLVYV